MNMTRLVTALLTVALCLVAQSASADMLTNGGFEDTGNAQPDNFSKPFTDASVGIPGWLDSGSSGNWGGGTSVTSHSGNECIYTYDTNAYVYQNVAVAAGNSYTIGGWFYHATAEANVRAKIIRVYWLDSGSNILSQEDVITTGTGTRWVYFHEEGTTTAPTNAVLARVEVGRQLVTGSAMNTTHIDDVTMVLVPEPATMVMLSVGAVMCLIRKRGNK